MRRPDTDEGYLQEYPELERWMNRCVECGLAGYRPDMPDEISGPGSTAGRDLRRLFCPVAVDRDGVCEHCRLAPLDGL